MITQPGRHRNVKAGGFLSAQTRRILNKNGPTAYTERLSPGETFIKQLIDFVRRHPGLFVLTGAGVSTDSGIPDYRDQDGSWKTSTPIQGPAFVRSESVRKRYWARSLIGWRHFGRAAPNAAHHALAALEELGYLRHLLTQNVDGLHQRAGSRAVTDLHGNLARVICLNCRQTFSRAVLQTRLEALNPDFLNIAAVEAPDGDARLETDFDAFKPVDCQACGGVLKPDVVFYGENVPLPRVARAMDELQQSDALLIVGSSLMVYSGYRFCLRAAELGLPIAAINLGKTRADDLFRFKISANCGATLDRLLAGLSERESA
ncbi:MAG: NAD-dependent protein deacetylase [Gammaproteobacteria bacterium]|nr:NAD-dependent protein deacetylase [Gammaproteobacteria bacterium]